MARSSSTSLDPAERRRIGDRFTKLIWDQVRPWVYMDTDGLDLKRFDGSPISFASGSMDGEPRQAMWETNYIEPFLEAICREETKDAARLTARQRAALRETLAEGILRVYLTMQEVDWHMHANGFCWSHDKTKIEPHVARMGAYLDRCLEGAAAQAA